MPQNLDIPSLTADLPDSPCGPDLEYDPDFTSLESEASDYGGNVPNWSKVVDLGLSLAGRTRDLRVACHLTCGLLATDGLVGLRQGLDLIHQLVQQKWPSVYPLLDGDDAIERINALGQFTDLDNREPQVIGLLRDAPFAGTYTVRDFLIAKSYQDPPPPVEGEEPREPATVAGLEGALVHIGSDHTAALFETVTACKETAEGIDQSVTEFVGVHTAPQFKRFLEVLERMHKYLDSHVGAGDNGEDDDDHDDDNGPGPGPGPTKPPGVNSRDDVVRALDLICSYYDRQEPGSPVPLLLQRARRLVTMPFLDAINDLVPNSLNDAKNVLGVVDSE